MAMELHSTLTDNEHGSMVSGADLGPCQPGLWRCICHAVHGLYCTQSPEQRSESHLQLSEGDLVMLALLSA